MEADDAEAEHWFRLAAEKENLFAQNALASLLLKRGKPEEAAHWLERAAKQGNPAAQYALGRLHLLGTGVPQDRVLAMELLGRSAAQGDSRAASLAKEPERVSFLPAAMAVTRMLHHMSRIFEHNCKQDTGKTPGLRPGVTIRGNEWFDHETQTGGHPIDFLRIHYQMSFPEAMRELLDGIQGQEFPAEKEKDVTASRLHSRWQTTN